MMRNRSSSIVVLGPPPGEPMEELIQIIIPPKPGEEESYANNETMMKTMDVCSLSMANIGQETNLPSSKLPFTLKLFEMLEHVADTGQEDIVSWVENGRAFRVHDLDKFVDDIIPIYFKQSKYKR
jgi:HSF-type DNA-binding